MPLNNVARAAIEELRGLGVSDLTPDEVVRLNDLGAAQLRAGRDGDGPPLRQPVRVGKTTLYPMTCAGADFVARWLDAPALPQDIRAWVFPFALAHGRVLSRIEEITDARDAVRAIKAWQRAAGVSLEELNNAVIRLADGDPVEKLEAAREGLLKFCGCVESISPEAASVFRDGGLSMLDELEEVEAASVPKQFRQPKNEPEAENPMFAWKAFAARLAALTGLPVEYWYRSDRRIAVIALRQAMSARAGFGESAGTSPPPELIDALRAMRIEMGKIAAARVARADKVEDGKNAGKQG